MDRRTLTWSLVLFFGGSIVFGAIREATEDEHVAVSLLAGLAVLAVTIVAIILIVRRGE